MRPLCGGWALHLPRCPASCPWPHLLRVDGLHLDEGVWLARHMRRQALRECHHQLGDAHLASRGHNVDGWASAWRADTTAGNLKGWPTQGAQTGWRCLASNAALTVLLQSTHIRTHARSRPHLLHVCDLGLTELPPLAGRRRKQELAHQRREQLGRA